MKKISNDIPAYIVGIPKNRTDSVIVSDKFNRIILQIKKAYPAIEEARATVKLHHSKGQRQFYQVTVNVISPYRTLNYTEVGWDFSQVFDLIGKKIRRGVARRRKRKYKKSIRKREPKIF